jgi:DNA repair exonuclease SbcCD ATPase subunit
MIPQRIFLRGFLSYRDEQEVRFDGSSLWMLSGVNGSGKSSVFDAVTFALFGYHRGGHQHAHELINADSDRAAVEFDFTQDDQAFRVRRTLARNARGGAVASQQVLGWIPAESPGEVGRWLPIEGTSRRAEFDDWVREHIGLNYETFTSSVLLLQGRAEKLLDSTAKGRFEVLAGIVDLERYQRLHEKADSQRKAAKADAERLDRQLEALDEVTELELTEAENRIAEAEEIRRQAQAEVDRWQGLEFQARRWAELQFKRVNLRQRWQQGQDLLAESGAIEKDLARLRELRMVLPHVETAIKQRRQADEAQERIALLTRERQDYDAQSDERRQGAEKARLNRIKLQEHLQADEKRLNEVTRELRRLEGVLAQVREHERQQHVLSQHEAELARLPGDVPQTLERLQAQHDQVAVLVQALPLLERLYRQREELRQASTAETAQAQDEQAIRSRGEKLRDEQKALARQLESVAQARQRADQALAAEQALFRQIEENWQKFLKLEGARICQQCGQQLTPGHYEKEKNRREKELGESQTRCRRDEEVQRAAQENEQSLRDQLDVLNRRLDEAREEYRTAHSVVEQLRRDAERHRAECAQAWSDLPVSYRAQVSASPAVDWLTTTYPTSAELEQARREGKEIAVLRRQLREARDVYTRWSALQAQVATMRETVAALAVGLPPDRPRLHEQHVSLEAEQATLGTRVKALREQDRAAEAERERLLREIEALQKKRAEREALINAAEATRTHCQQALAAALKGLPPPWPADVERAGLGGWHVWCNERDELEQRGTEEKARALEQARLGLEELRLQLEEVDSECAQVPAAAQCPLPEVQQQLSTVRRNFEKHDEAYRRAQQEHMLLVTRRQQRESIQRQILEAEREEYELKLLSQLLSRERLQLYLVRQAERQIVDHANAVLDRLSGGELFLRLRGSQDGEGEADEALELEAYNRTTGQKPINVAFLSGSQRFRVAVGLALGIGQYASRQHRPIESVIIDEGFGCLDRQGRQVMIQELQNLRGHLHCILLVSHQEEFAEAFTDGYHFELADGTTRVTRIQR